ncbi:hypothetical protein PDIG_65540 [Penicillium digitatum PHI26]|uniref:Uncharacterized protein n=2 Tax=Penicillium digitatum TaxID=36651 RepID=K9FGQ5_PEND2|nr:hypothetical protein PDIP_74860 [Penicillium digitatum Pd1]EKV07244.1 hypothetical protein PDIP_74860 [Penicillium digitatum Pd1]EKV08690.1 hypothetical protein PDIG_65540 [Penicillium digitatum PHI26]
MVILRALNLLTVGCNLLYGRSSSPRFPRGRLRFSVGGRKVSSFLVWGGHGAETRLRIPFISLEARNMNRVTDGRVVPFGEMFPDASSGVANMKADADTLNYLVDSPNYGGGASFQNGMFLDVVYGVYICGHQGSLLSLPSFPGKKKKG